MNIDFGTGLCGVCRWRRTIQSGKGSIFHLCERSKVDPMLPKYPRLPVFSCRGFEQLPSGEEAQPGDGA